MLLNNRTLIGVDWGAWTGRDPGGQRALLGEILDRGRATVGSTRRSRTGHRLEDAGAVLQAALDRQLVGKTVLVP